MAARDPPQAMTFSHRQSAAYHPQAGEGKGTGGYSNSARAGRVASCITA